MSSVLYSQLPAVFPVRSLCSLTFLVSSEIRSSCIPPFPADYLSFSSPMRSVLFSVSSVLCCRCVSPYETFGFHHLPANLSYQFAVRMLVDVFPVCSFKWNPYVSPWVPNGFPPIPRRAVVMCSFAFPVCLAPCAPRTLHRYVASAWVRGGIPAIFPVHLQCFRKHKKKVLSFLFFFHLIFVLLMYHACSSFGVPLCTRYSKSKKQKNLPFGGSALSVIPCILQGKDPLHVLNLLYNHSKK